MNIINLIFLTADDPFPWSAIIPEPKQPEARIKSSEGLWVS